MTQTTPPRTAALVACDVVGHSSVDRHAIQLARVRGINKVVKRVLARDPECALWASGGDGGHVLFLMEEWQEPALDCARELWRWAQREDVPLRIAAHVGPLSVIRGADDRMQPVGDAINAAGWMLSRGSAAGIVVSSQFRAATLGRPGVEFHDERLLRLKQGTPQELWLMSLSELGMRSRWSDAVAEDRQRLMDAIALHRGCDAVYYAKRLLQVDGMDEEVTEALARLGPIDFVCRSSSGEEKVNPILGHLGLASLRKMIGLGQLIERGYNEVICRRGDGGSTMFVILRGQVGVYVADDGARPDPARPRVTLSEGQIVGELAFALNRPRTADLVSLGDTALLSFEHEEVAKLLNGSGELIWEFMNGRALEHVSQNVPYLIGRQLGGLPEAERQPWMGMLGVLRSDTQIISRKLHHRLTLADIRPRENDPAGAGIYILAGGHLQSESNPEKQLTGEEFPLLYVDLPDLVVAPDHPYVVVEGPAKIIFIGLEAINALRHPVRARLVAELKRSMAKMYHHDVFIAYNFADEPTARRWERGLREAGLKVFRDWPHPGEPYPERDGAALLDSLTMLVLVSPNAMYKDPEQNWLMKEVKFRRRHFERPRIVPVQLPQGNSQVLDLLYSEIHAEGREEAAIEEAVTLVRAIREGAQEPPYALRRHTGTRIT